MITTTQSKAEAKGYKALTIPYRLPEEDKMLQNTMNDMASGGIDAVLVVVKDGVEVWRKPCKQLVAEDLWSR